MLFIDNSSITRTLSANGKTVHQKLLQLHLVKTQNWETFWLSSYCYIYLVHSSSVHSISTGDRMVILLPMTPVQLSDAALSSLTQATILSWSVKCVATSKQWVAAVEDCRWPFILSGQYLSRYKTCGTVGVITL